MGEPTSSERVFGLRAVLAVWQTRPGELRRMAHAVRPEGELLGLVQAATRAGVQVMAAGERELAAFAGSTRHEGVCVEVTPRKWLNGKALSETMREGIGFAVALDRVRNPYNIGAITRTSAFFGARAMLLGTPAPDPGLPAEAVRVAEGGAEQLAFSRTTDLGETLRRLRELGVRVLGADGQATTSLWESQVGGRCMLVVGNEREGLLPRVRAQCDVMVAIPGTGAVESLNVAVAAGVLVGEIARQQGVVRRGNA